MFCDILTQELHQRDRIVEIRGDFVACCPYASRAPFETWIVPVHHEAHFEHTAISRPGALRDCASLLRRILNRIRSITDSFHLVVHTAPNTQHQSKALNYWRTIDEDYHWHIEILPILAGAAEIVLVQGKLSLGGDAGGGSGAAAGSSDRTHGDLVVGPGK